MVGLVKLLTPSFPQQSTAPSPRRAQACVAPVTSSTTPLSPATATGELVALPGPIGSPQQATVCPVVSRQVCSLPLAAIAATPETVGVAGGRCLSLAAPRVPSHSWPHEL